MENYKRRAVELISNLMLEYKGEPAVIPYSPQKTKISALEAPSLKRGNPQRYGISPSILRELLTKLEEEKRANIHSIMIIKDGTVICEASRPGYSQNYAHLSHSMSKSVIGIVIGMLYDDGKIDTDDLVIDFFNNGITEGTKLNTLTVHHLLSMKSGISFSEVGSVTESEWARAIFTAEPDFSPGERFAYNSMNSYLLACIAEKLVKEHYGISLIDYIDKRLFIPLGIRNRLWEIGPEGIEKGGWGLYLSAESFAKIGIMMLDGGMSGGKRILSERWIQKSTSIHARVPEETGDFDYGYQIWIGKDGEDFLFNGMLGQNLWVFKKRGIVVSLNSGNEELFQRSPTLEIIRNCLMGDLKSEEPVYPASQLSALKEKERNFFISRQWLTPRVKKHGLPYALGLLSSSPFEERFLPLIGRYVFPKNGHGILPFFVRLMQNNYQGGITSFTFKRNRELLRLVSTEGSEDYTIDFGFYSYKENVLFVDGEKYIALGLADTAEDEGGNIIYRLEVIFPELPNTRRILLSREEGLTLKIKMTEIPDAKIADSFIASIPAMNPRIRIALDLLEKNLGKNFIKTKLGELFSPEMLAIRTDSPIYEKKLKEENDRLEKKIASSRLIRSLITRFVALTDEKCNLGGVCEKEKPLEKSGMLKTIISRLFS